MNDTEEIDWRNEESWQKDDINEVYFTYIFSSYIYKEKGKNRSFDSGNYKNSSSQISDFKVYQNLMNLSYHPKTEKKFTLKHNFNKQNG